MEITKAIDQIVKFADAVGYKPPQAKLELLDDLKELSKPRSCSICESGIPRVTPSGQVSRVTICRSCISWKWKSKQTTSDLRKMWRDQKRKQRSLAEEDGND